MISVHFQGKPFNVTVIQVYALTTNYEEAEVEWFCEDLQDLLKQIPKKDVLFITEDWNAKAGRDTTFGPEVQNEAGQRLENFVKRMHWSQQTPSFNNTREDSTDGHHQVVNAEIKLIIFFAPKTEKLYTVSRNKTGSQLRLRS